MTIETTYKGYKIRWSDNGDAWTCSDLGILSKSMISMRALIDKAALSVRKKSAVQALLVNDQGEVRETTVIQFLGSKGSFGGSDRVAIMAMPMFGGDRLSRQEASLQNLMPVGDEVLEQALQLREIRAQQRKLGEQAAALYKAIPRLTKKHIAELVRIADAGEIEA